MKIAPCAENEKERLEALSRYGILDTEAEADFDGITRLLAAICETPIALVSLIDRDRQWFKSRVGLEPSETKRDLAFCAHAILQNNPLVVEDTLLDERFADNPLVTSDPYIRFYAGSPLVTPDGYAIGTLCAIDTRPRTLSANQLNALNTLARHVIVLLELRLQLQETRRLNDELLRSRQALAEASESKSRFFANINHEMRTPLSAILGFNRRLKTRLGNETVPDYLIEGLNLIENAGRQLSDLVDDILDISKLEAGKMKLEPAPFNVRKALRSVLSTIGIRAEENAVSLVMQTTPDIPETLVGDVKMFEHVLLNLLSNAVKFTPADKQVMLLGDWRDQQLVLQVVDEGIGIPLEDQQRIFQPFEQSRNRPPSSVKGTGLGLSIVKGLVDLMQGTITVESRLNQGTRITLFLPLAVA